MASPYTPATRNRAELRLHPFLSPSPPLPPFSIIGISSLRRTPALLDRYFRSVFPEADTGNAVYCFSSLPLDTQAAADTAATAAAGRRSSREGASWRLWSWHLGILQRHFPLQRKPPIT
ncbi:hypothetical protein cyc_03210 [Cyclospora cayetanensis]|uniref:Uncharacterized protein n=1 Tax=Cyclospora cayetanensis TaxID=88456 RepID=A0A1D3D7C3_9EIME|nr:hypothetical protein cyc_03210 [Cyclospora cayetanensis]